MAYEAIEIDTFEIDTFGHRIRTRAQLLAQLERAQEQVRQLDGELIASRPGSHKEALGALKRAQAYRNDLQAVLDRYDQDQTLQDKHS